MKKDICIEVLYIDYIEHVNVKTSKFSIVVTHDLFPGRY